MKKVFTILMLVALGVGSFLATDWVGRYHLCNGGFSGSAELIGYEYCLQDSDCAMDAWDYTRLHQLRIKQFAYEMRKENSCENSVR